MLQEAVGQDTSAGQKARLDAIKTALALGEIRLYKDSLVPNPNTTLAEFTAAEADFTGYAEVVMTFSADALDAEGGWVSQCGQAFFQCTADTPDNSIGGAFLLSQGAPDFAFEFFPFPVAVNLSVALSSLTLQVAVREPNPDTAIAEN